MSDDPPRTFWDSQERIGRVSLSEQDVLLVAKLQHGSGHYVRLQVHRRSVVDDVPTTTPGTKGMILPLVSMGEVAELLRRVLEAEERPPSLADRFRAAPDEEDEPFS